MQTWLLLAIVMLSLGGDVGIGVRSAFRLRAQAGCPILTMGECCPRSVRCCHDNWDFGSSPRGDPSRILVVDHAECQTED
jgi:hypothetical protein